MGVLTLKGRKGWGYIGDLHMSVYFTYMRAKVFAVHVPLLATVEMAVRQSVVVQCGTFKCLVTFEDAMDEKNRERCLGASYSRCTQRENRHKRSPDTTSQERRVGRYVN